MDGRRRRPHVARSQLGFDPPSPNDGRVGANDCGSAKTWTVDDVAWGGEYYVVEGVESLKPEFERSLFAEQKSSKDRGIKVLNQSDLNELRPKSPKVNGAGMANALLSIHSAGLALFI